MRAGADPSIDIEARLDGEIVVRNTTDRAIELAYPAVLPSSLEWTIRRRDGACFRPTFLPPPVPPADGIPRLELTVPAEGEAPLARVHGVSGYRACQGDPAGDTETWHRVLPAGEYEVSIAGIELEGRDPLRTEPAALTVR